MPRISVTEWTKMYDRIDKMTNPEVQSVWYNLRNYDPAALYAPGITMDDWAQAIYSEMDMRGMPHIKVVK